MLSAKPQNLALIFLNGWLLLRNMYILINKKNKKHMKKITIILTVLMISSLMQAQIFINQDTMEVQEEYLAELFKQADVVFCKVDDVDDFVYVKNMLVVFNVDSTLFRTAYIESNFYGATITAFYPVWCTYVELTDINGNQLKLALKTPITPLERGEQPLNDYKILIPILDSLLQKTDIVDYSKDTTIFLDIDQD